MWRLSFVPVLLASFLSMAGCADEQAPIDRVGVNVVEKSVFEGSWLYLQTVIDVDYEAAGIGTYPGDSAYDFAATDLSSVPRVRWVIDENYLYAYRDYELLQGADTAAVREEGDLGQPVAAFPIESHFDINRAYNSVTGEEQNVIVENTSDRRWYERQYMRVDWSQNMLPGYFGQIANLYEVLGYYIREPAGLFIQGQSDFPNSWRPNFYRMTCSSVDDDSEGCHPHDRDWANDYEQGDMYAFNFVTQDLLSPGNVPDPFTGRPVNWCNSIYSDAPTCTTVATYVRHSFLKISETREYQPMNWADTRFDRHAYFRLERPVYDRSTDVTDPGWGYTDFMNYRINRHNIWYDHFQKDGNGEIVRDPATGRAVPMPYNDRRLRPIVWYSTPELPAHLVKPSFQLVVGDWNRIMMGTVRNLRGQPDAEYPRVDCNLDDPDGYCACVFDPDSGEILNPTCEGRYDPFLTPDQHASLGAVNPYDCWVDVPDGAEPDMNVETLTDNDFYGWYGARVRGSECVTLLRMNTCHRGAVAEAGGIDQLECEERGDGRFKFLSYVDQPGTDFLGIATLRGDPVTGEIFFGDANIGGPALDGFRTFALETYDLVNGNVTDQEFLIGEDVRGYLENLDSVDLPAPPRTDFNVALRNGTDFDPGLRTSIDRRMARFAERAERLRGPEGRANTYHDHVSNLVGSTIERRLMENQETLAMAGIDHIPPGITPADINDAILDQTSPFRMNAHEILARDNELATKLSMANVMMPNEYVDNSVLSFVERHAGWPRARVEFTLNRLLFYQTQVHELGHCMGLRHMFGASADTHNYYDEYYAIDERFPLPDPRDYDTDGTSGLSPEEEGEWRDAYDSAQSRRERAGIDATMNSSIMEYTGQWYERTTAATSYFDRAAINYGYGDLVEVGDNTGGVTMEDLNPTNVPRRWVKYYMGGEVCAVDTDCPYSGGGSHASELLPLNLETGLTQRCRESICSNFDADHRAMAGSDDSPRWAPIDYRNCTDDRVGTIGWCHRFDEGDSYREIVANAAEAYRRSYIFTHFRRYRSNWSIGNAISGMRSRYFNTYQAIFNSLLYAYNNDPEFRDSTGPFGFYDQFLASVDILNTYAAVLGEPDIGSYRWDENWSRYVRSSIDPLAPGAELRMPLGSARYISTIYQSGLSGINRIERSGTFYDKWITLQFLAFRGWTTSYTRDVPFWTNYYDLFPVEIQQIFTGMIQERPEAFSPRVECRAGTFPRCDNPRVVYMDFYRGDCSDPATCRPNPEDTYAELNVLDGGSRFLLQYLATIYALLEFPTSFDSSFINQLFICRLGQADCHSPAPDAVEGVDYVQYESSRYGVTFQSWQVEPTEDVPNQTSIGFAMVQEAGDNDFIIKALQKYRGDGGGDPFEETNLEPEELERLDDLGYEIPADAQVDAEILRLDGRLRDLESFFNQVIELQRQSGITVIY